jgi:hypothetical protein
MIWAAPKPGIFLPQIDRFVRSLDLTLYRSFWCVVCSVEVWSLNAKRQAISLGRSVLEDTHEAMTGREGHPWAEPLTPTCCINKFMFTHAIASIICKDSLFARIFYHRLMLLHSKITHGSCVIVPMRATMRMLVLSCSTSKQHAQLLCWIHGLIVLCRKEQYVYKHCEYQRLISSRSGFSPAAFPLNFMVKIWSSFLLLM